MAQELRRCDQHRDTASTQLSKLMLTVATGDTAAFARVYDLTAAQVFAVTIRVLKNRALAEEVLQEVYLYVWQNASKFVAARGTVGAWISIIAHRRAVDSVRATQASGKRDWREGTRLAQGDVDDSYDRVDNHAELQHLTDALSRLSAEQRQYLDLAYGAGLSQADIAVHTGVPLGTVKSRTRSALAELRRCLHNNPAFGAD